MEKRLEQIEEILREAGAETSNDMVEALEDGELLARLGIADTEAVEELHARYTAAVRIAQPTIDLAQNYMAPFSFGSTIRQVMEGFILWVQEQNLRV